MDEIETPIVDHLIEKDEIVEVLSTPPKITKKEKPRTTPIRSSSTPNMKRIELVKLPPFKPSTPMSSPKLEESPIKETLLDPVKSAMPDVAPILTKVVIENEI